MMKIDKLTQTDKLPLYTFWFIRIGQYKIIQSVTDTYSSSDLIKSIR